MEMTVAEKIDTIVELLKQTAAGPCAVAIAGAHAKGTADSSSDIDIYLFADSYKPYAERSALIKSIADPDKFAWISENAEDAPWGGSMDFTLAGTPVEVNFRTFAMVDRNLDDCMDGRFKIIPATWTSNGYYTFIYLSELSFIRPIWDPENRLAAYQQRVHHYPEKLRQSIMRIFMERTETWLDNFHYDSAIGRCDTLFTAPIVLHTLMDMVQVIFALNRRYFTGDKKLEKALSSMAICPSVLLAELPFLLNAHQNAEGLERQRQILRAARNELYQAITADQAQCPQS